MKVECNDCKRIFEEEKSYYCFSCEHYICQFCYDNHVFQGEDIHRMYHIEDVQYKVINYSHLKGYCKTCDEIFDLKHYYHNHYKHAFDLIELNPKNNKKKKIMISDRACGPELEIMTFSKEDFLSKFNHSEKVLDKINSHEPVFLLSHTSVKSLDECNYIDYMDQLSESDLYDELYENYMFCIKENVKKIDKKIYLLNISYVSNFLMILSLLFIVGYLFVFLG